MKYINLTKGKQAMVDDEDYERVVQYKWHYHGVYARKNAPKQYLHHFILKTKVRIDHKNGDQLDYRNQNLRFCTQKQNCFNQSLKKNNTSGYKGVYFDKRGKKIKRWQAYISPEGKKKHLGYFLTAKKAAKAYNIAAQQFFGEFARLNIL